MGWHPAGMDTNDTTNSDTGNSAIGSYLFLAALACLLTGASIALASASAV